MMYRCVECGQVFEEPDTWEESRGEYWGMPCHETMSGCPECHGDYEEVFECEECGEWFFEDELEDGLCEKCRENMEEQNVYQLTVFDVLCQNKPLPNRVKLLSLFSGIGAFEKALDNIGISYDLVGYCEIDKYASKSYSAIHGVSEDKNLWDVTKVNEKSLPKDIDLCFRLMGFDDADFHKAELINSNTQLYKQAGNSIVVDVLEYLLKTLFENL